ncbi:hypothetical protein PanWU01x14_349970 [Parasponia andersonii]|uniref:Uncharacterized protein n=1 Tax=Parasponia andersonii TaxID=3476 RepID=A0A2P5AB47_PARAD|nr:hypothetical protein PanWU01x14_349970 [Parasponia andersonii]
MAMDRVMKIQNKLQVDDFSEEVFWEEVDALAALDNALTLYDSFLRDKYRIRWLEGEDCNSFFYYVALKRRTISKLLSYLIINDKIVIDSDRIIAYTVNFYASLFFESNYSLSDFSIIQEHAPTLVTEHDNTCLLSFSLEQEIRNIVFDMDPSSALGPDGYTRRYFRSCWPIVCNDFILVVL